MWFVHIYKGGGLSLYKSVNISTDEISENEFKCMGELTPDEKFFRLEIKDNKIIFKSDAKKKSMFNYSVCIRDEKGNIITDILTKEILEEAITNNTIVLDSPLEIRPKFRRSVGITNLANESLVVFVFVFEDSYITI